MLSKERHQTATGPSFSPDMLKGFARKARERIRPDGGGYRRDHLPARAARRGRRRQSSHHGIKIGIIANSGRRFNRRNGGVLRSQFCKKWCATPGDDDNYVYAIAL